MRLCVNDPKVNISLDMEKVNVTHCPVLNGTYANKHNEQQSAYYDRNTSLKGSEITVVCNSDMNMVTNKFQGYHRNRVDRFFVSGISKASSENDMRAYLQERNIRFFDNPNSTRNSAQLNVSLQESDIIHNRSFWPTGIKVRKWISRSKFYLRSEYSDSNNIHNG